MHMHVPLDTHAEGSHVPSCRETCTTHTHHTHSHAQEFPTVGCNSMGVNTNLPNHPADPTCVHAG